MNARCTRIPGILALLCLLLARTAIAGQATAAKADALKSNEMPSVTTVPDAARASDHFNANAATEAYLATIPPTAKSRSDAYFEGGYWMLLWDFLFAVAMYWLLLRFRISAVMRNVAERVTRFKPIQTFLYVAQFTVVTTLIGFPLAAYEGFFREWKYGLATQSFGGWIVDQVKLLLVGIVMGGIFATVLFGVVRKLPRTWHVWGSAVALLFLIFGIAIAPVVLIPMFYNPTKLNDP